MREIKMVARGGKIKSEEITTKHGTIWLEDGILHTSANPNVEHTLMDAKRDLMVFRNLALGVKRPLLSDISNVKSVSREAREFFAGEETGKIISAIGLIIKSPISRVIGNFYLSVNRPSFPVKLFTSEEEAIRWLKPFIGDINGK